jgi:polygalacturonase
VSTDEDGFFEFWVDDTEYSPGQKFKITLSHADFEDKSYDDLEIIPFNVHNVFSYNVTGDGTTDDTANLQTAVTAIPTGGTLYFPHGTYIISNLTGVSNMRITGDPGAVLKHKAAATDHMIEGSGDLEIIGLTIDGNRENITSWTISPIDFSGNRLYIDNCKFTGSRRSAVWFDSDERVRIKNCEFTDMQEHGGTTGQDTLAIYGAPTTSAQIWILNNDFIHGTPADADSAPGGVLFSGAAASIRVTGNYFKNIGQRKASNMIGNVDFYTDCQDVIVADNRVENYYYIAFKLSNMQRCVVANNIIDGEADSSAEQAISLTNARSLAETLTDWVVEGNIVYLNGNEIGIYAAGRAEVTNPSARINVSNNIIYNTTEGIQLRYLSGLTSVRGNIIDTAATLGIRILDTAGSVEISGGHVSNISGVGIYARTNVTNLELNISNVFFDSTTTYDVSVRDATSLSVTGCKSVDTPANTVDVNNVTSIFLAGNQAETGTLNKAGTNTNFIEYGNSWSDAVVTHVATGSITKGLHKDRLNLLGEVGGDALVTLTLPEATGSGDVYRFVVSVVNTSNYVIVTADTTNCGIYGTLNILDVDSNAQTAYAGVAADDKITLNGTTSGGQIGDWLELTDIATDQWSVRGNLVCPAGSDVADPFSSS